MEFIMEYFGNNIDSVQIIFNDDGNINIMTKSASRLPEMLKSRIMLILSELTRKSNSVSSDKEVTLMMKNP